MDRYYQIYYLNVPNEQLKLMMLVEYYWTVSRSPCCDAFKEVYVMVFLVHWDGLEKGNGYNIL